MFADQNATAWTAQDWRFTAKDGAIYAFCLNPADTPELVCKTFAAFDGTHRPAFNGRIVGVEELGFGLVPFERQTDGLHLRIFGRHRQSGVPQADGALPVGFRLEIG